MLVKQFNADPGHAFLETIKLAGRPVDAKQIKGHLKAAGISSSDVDGKWKRMQPFINEHPHIRKPVGRLYEWSIEPVASGEALRRMRAHTLSSVPGWLTGALVTTISDSLAAAEASGPRSQSTWGEQRELEKAQVLAKVATEFEALLSKGQTAVEVFAWIQDQAVDRELEPIATIGERVAFDPDLHDSASGAMRRGSSAEVVRSGYRWLGADRPMVVLRAVVRPL